MWLCYVRKINKSINNTNVRNKLNFFIWEMSFQLKKKTKIYNPSNQLSCQMITFRDHICINDSTNDID